MWWDGIAVRGGSCDEEGRWRNIDWLGLWAYG